MFSMITYIVLFKDGFFSVFLSGCLADTELSFLPERYSRCFRVDDMIQKEPFTAQYASYIDKCDQSDRRKNELEPFFPSCLSLVGLKNENWALLIIILTFCLSRELEKKGEGMSVMNDDILSLIHI